MVLAQSLFTSEQKQEFIESVKTGEKKRVGILESGMTLEAAFIYGILMFPVRLCAESAAFKAGQFLLEAIVSTRLLFRFAEKNCSKQMGKHLSIKCMKNCAGKFASIILKRATAILLSVRRRSGSIWR